MLALLVSIPAAPDGAAARARPRMAGRQARLVAQGVDRRLTGAEAQLEALARAHQCPGHRVERGLEREQGVLADCADVAFADQVGQARQGAQSASARRAFSPAAKNCSFQRSTSATVRPCLRAASLRLASPFTTPITNATLRLAGQPS